MMQCYFFCIRHVPNLPLSNMTVDTYTARRLRAEEHQAAGKTWKHSWFLAFQEFPKNAKTSDSNPVRSQDVHPENALARSKSQESEGRFVYPSS